MAPSRRARTQTDQDGFTIVESMIALGLIFSVLIALLAALSTGVRGVVTGRQRSIATSIANEVVETARSRSYTEVGHDLDSDPTLASDPAIQGSVPNLVYTDLSAGPGEPLAGSIVDAGAGAGGTTNPLFPFSPHRWQTVQEGTTYTASVYVTLVTPSSGDPYRRLTVLVTWQRTQAAATAALGEVRLSSYLFNAAQPPDPLFAGLAEADAGTVTVTGTLTGIDLSDARLWLPFAHGEIDSRFVRRVTGFAGTTRSLVNLRSGSASGCTGSNGGLTAECTGTKAETGSDNDAATAPTDHNAAGPASDPGGVLAVGDKLSSALGAGTARSLSTARSCWSCYGTGVDDDDRLPYHWGQATGPDSLSLAFTAGPVTGSLLTSAAACSSCSTVSLDRDDVSGATRLLSTASAAHPPIDLVPLDAAPAGYAGMVRLGTTSVSTTATSGPGALAPSFTASPVSVQIYDTTTPTPGYRALTITPGTPSETTGHAEMVVNGAQVIMDATVRSGPAVTLSTPSGGALTEAQASLSNWLSVDVHLVVTDPTGTLADLTVSLDYGRVTTRATYQPAPA